MHFSTQVSYMWHIVASICKGVTIKLIGIVSVMWHLQHSGFLHVALGCWVLLTFGPRVCRAYGQVTFLLIYILGGVCGNLTSFLHTPELTVCGTVSCKPTCDVFLNKKYTYTTVICWLLLSMNEKFISDTFMLFALFIHWT
jgi:hypothetical protein